MYYIILLANRIQHFNTSANCARTELDQSKDRHSITSKPERIFSINDSILTLFVIFSDGCAFFIDVQSTVDVCPVSIRCKAVLLMWREGDDGGLRPASPGLLSAESSSSLIVLLDAMTSPSLQHIGLASGQHNIAKYIV